jgi:hypothetical protein
MAPPEQEKLIMAYKVIKPLVITKKQDGSDLYLYYGAVLPDFVSDEEVKRLVDGRSSSRSPGTSPRSRRRRAPSRPLRPTEK